MTGQADRVALAGTERPGDYPGNPEAAERLRRKTELDRRREEPDGAQLLDDLVEALGRYVAYPSQASCVAVALWAAHTHTVEHFDSTPRLALLSPEPQCGKSRTLEVLELLVRAPLAVQSVTPAVLARTIDDHPTTVLLDEADAIFGARAKDNEDLRAILNAGHRRGAGYARMVGEGARMTAKTFAVFAPVALAGIGDLPETVMQRSIVLRMRRRAPDEYVEPFRYRKAAEYLSPLRHLLADWAGQIAGQIATAEPVMPSGITDRPADVWEPLLAIADAAGGDWPKRARAACVELVSNSATSSTASLGVRLLADLRDVFADAAQLPTDEVLRRLLTLEEAPWSDLRGRPLDARSLARWLRPYGVGSAQWRDGDARHRGYLAADLHDPWARYLPSPSAESVTTVTTVTGEQQRRSAAPFPVTDDGRDAVTMAPPLTSDVTVVTDVTDFRQREAEHRCKGCGASVIPAARAIEQGFAIVCGACA